jgi:hypothetical protein
LEEIVQGKIFAYWELAGIENAIQSKLFRFYYILPHECAQWILETERLPKILVDVDQL